MDPLHRLLKLFDHNRYLVVALALLVCASVWLVACESTTASLNDPRESVDRIQFRMQAIAEQEELDKAKAEIEAAAVALNARVEAHNAKVQAGTEDLDAQDAAKVQIVNAVGGAVVQAASGTLNPVGLAATIVGVGGGLLGVGAFADKRRADGVITDLRGRLARSPA